jgi:hypothetical protein
MTPCHAPVPQEALLAYWVAETSEHDSARIEEHLFACAHCAGQLEQLTATAHGVDALARQGRIAGIVPFEVLNRLARDGVRVRYYSLAPGQSVPCAAWPGDEVFIVGLRADLADVRSVSLLMTGPDGTEIARANDVPVAPGSTAVLHAIAGALVRQMPSMKIRLTLTDAGPGHRLLGEYVLEHSAV